MDRAFLKASQHRQGGSRSARRVWEPAPLTLVVPDKKKTENGRNKSFLNPQSQIIRSRRCSLHAAQNATGGDTFTSERGENGRTEHLNILPKRNKRLKGDIHNHAWGLEPYMLPLALGAIVYHFFIAWTVFMLGAGSHAEQRSAICSCGSRPCCCCAIGLLDRRRSVCNSPHQRKRRRKSQGGLNS